MIEKFKKQINSPFIKVGLIFYGLIYLSGFIAPLIGKSMDELESIMSLVEIYTVPFAFLIFAIGVVIAWFNEKVGGMILLIWHFTVWLFSMYLWPQAGMVLILIFPILYLSAFLILNWYKRHVTKYTQPINQWKLVLNILMINYAVIYLLVVIAEIIPKLFGVVLRQDPAVLNNWNYNTKEIIILIALFVLFLISYLSTLKFRYLSGILLVLWFVLLGYLGLTSFNFLNSGPWLIFSLPILFQGILYIILHFKEKKLA